MIGGNLVLVVGTYADAEAAADDFTTLKTCEKDGEYEVVGVVVMNRDATGKVEVHEGYKSLKEARQQKSQDRGSHR